MRILTALNIGYPIVGGAQINHQTYLRLLGEKFGHDCVYLDKAQTRRRIETRGALRLDSFRDIAEMRQKIESFQPDILISGFTAIHDIVKIGARLGIPVIGWLDSFEYCPPSEMEKANWGVTQTHRNPDPQERKYALDHADQIVANSHYLRRRLWQQMGVEAAVIYPAFYSDILLPGPSKGDYITGICGYPHKGAEIFLALARAFPDQLFLQVGPVHADYFAQFRSLPNMKIVPFGPIKKIFRQAKIMIVPSLWPEPFGRIAVEAMANGIPTLASRQAGLGEIIRSGEQGIEDYTNAQAWIEALEAVLSDENRYAANAESGRHIAGPFLGEEPIRQLNDLVHAFKRKPVQENKVVQLVGNQQLATAFSFVNFQFQRSLGGNYTVYPTERIQSFVPALPDVVIHHDLGQEFSKLTLPSAGHFVAYRTWDFGRFPVNWVKLIEENCDQLWVYSRWIKKQAELSGIPNRRVRVIPLGFDPQVFKPEGTMIDLPTDKSFRFLFAGATVLRKGIDVLVKAYTQAFSKEDDVCLVIKDNSSDVFYEGERWREKIAELQDIPETPDIHLIEPLFSAVDMAMLYRSATVGVFPYRAEGFALPILETMACGTPSIVPQFGACLDYCSNQTSFFVPARRINLPVFGEFAFNTLGFKEEIDEVDFCEVSPEILASEMRRVYEKWRQDGGREINRHAQNGVAKAQGHFTWQHTQRRIHKALQELSEVRTPIRFRRQRQANERQKQIFAAARELYLDLPVSDGLPIRKV